MAVTFAPDAEYVALDAGEWIYIVAKALAQQTIEKCNLGEAKEIALFPGAKLEYATFAHPFLDRSVLGVLGDYVTMDTGTGAVHTAPAHGADDFNTGVKYGLDLRCDVDDAGIIRNGLPEYQGQQVFKANPLIVDLLKAAACCSALRRSSTPIRIAGAATIPSSSAPPSSGSSRWKASCRQPQTNTAMTRAVTPFELAPWKRSRR
jgi:isoleucyl-tRNA synthetase